MTIILRAAQAIHQKLEKNDVSVSRSDFPLAHDKAVSV